MPIDVIMPPLSQTMDVVVLVKWLKRVGEPVTKGEPLFTIETDKAMLEVESPASGVLQQILTPEKSEARVRSKVALIAAPGEPAPPADVVSTPPERPSSPVEPVEIGPPAERAPLPQGRRERIFASPRARGLAEREGVALAGLTPSGPQGMIVERDVRAHLALRSTATPVRQATAPRLADTAAFQREADVSSLLALQGHILPGLPAGAPRLSVADFLLSIVARQLGRHPRLNALDDGEHGPASQAVHIAIAVETAQGLLLPVLRDAQRRRPLELAGERERLTQRGQAGRLSAEDLDGATFTLVDLGNLGIDAFSPSLMPPQVAALGVGRMRPSSEAGGRRLMSLTLVVDRRHVDDASAARFLAGVVEWIENPYLLL